MSLHDAWHDAWHDTWHDAWHDAWHDLHCFEDMPWPRDRHLESQHAQLRTFTTHDALLVLLILECGRVDALRTTERDTTVENTSRRLLVKS